MTSEQTAQKTCTIVVHSSLSSMIGRTSIKPNTEPSLKTTGPGHMYVIVCYPAQEVRETPSLCHGQERFSNWSSGATRGLVRACGLLEVTLLEQQRGIQQEDSARRELSGEVFCGPG